MKGLAVRFFAALRMTVLKDYIVKCTNVLHSGLDLLETFSYQRVSLLPMFLALV